MNGTKKQSSLPRRLARINSDEILKELFQASGALLWQTFTQHGVKRFLNIEFSATRACRADLIAEQDMPWRELEYYTLSYRQCGRIPWQLVIYVGRAKLRMAGKIEHPKLKYEYDLLDIRKIAAAPLLASADVETNIIGFLCGQGATRTNLQRILSKIGQLKGKRRRDALEKLALLAGLRVKSKVFRQEAIKLGLEAEIKDNPIINHYFKEGRQEGQVNFLRKLLSKRFGQLPEWVNEYLRKASTSELEQAGLRLLEATSLEEVFPAAKVTKKRTGRK
jgi:hypothetical protein